jgi:A/G-specific adenine glycosylase
VEHPVITRPGDLNQALIELGSTVCKPKDPACGTCPIRTSCGAYTLQQAELVALAGDSRAPAALADAAPGPLANSTVLVSQPEVPDLEELCDLCEPFPDNGPMRATFFPMKVEKKKAREETDLVHVMEWRPSASPNNRSSHNGEEKEVPHRWFLLVKRPEGGACSLVFISVAVPWL